MITKLTLENFKGIGKQEYEFTNFDLLVGRNNSGKSTILQALATWQFCVDALSRNKKDSPVEVVLPNFTALPVPTFDLLWNDQLLVNIVPEGPQPFRPINITVDFKKGESLQSFGVSIRPHSGQTIYIFPGAEWDGFKNWNTFRQLEPDLPVIAFVPPFSGLNPLEEYRDDAVIRRQIGLAQPGSVLRNLLFRTQEGWRFQPNGKPDVDNWEEIRFIMQKWFGVEVFKPQYRMGEDTEIVCNYDEKKKIHFDLIAGGSGFQQILTILAILFSSKPTTFLLDEPDAHLHGKLQRQLLEYLWEKSLKPPNLQIIIATHAEEFIKGVPPQNIISLLGGIPQRLPTAQPLLSALAGLSNDYIAELSDSPFILYLEGKTDLRILLAWAGVLQTTVIGKFCDHPLGGGSKQEMMKKAKEDVNAVKTIVDRVQHLILLDRNGKSLGQVPHVIEWKRRNIENYLAVPDAWVRASTAILGGEETEQSKEAKNLIENFFSQARLTLLPGQTWKTVADLPFRQIDGKEDFFEKDDSLYYQLVSFDKRLSSLRKETLAAFMTPDEIHEDVHQFFAKLESLTAEVPK